MMNPPDTEATGFPGRFVSDLSASHATLVVRILSVVALLGIWWVIALFFDAIIFPGPGPVVEKVVDIMLHERFLFHLSHTFGRVLAAFTIGLLLASTVGILMGLDDTAEEFFETFVLVGLTIPALAVSVITLLVLGFSNLAAVVAIVIVITPPMTQNVWEGTKNLDPDLLKMGRVFEADRRMLLTDIVLPQLVPYLLAATRFGLGIGWKIAVIVEWIGLGNGIGQKLRDSFDVFSLTGVMAWTLSFVLVMTVLEFGIIKQVERYLSRWQSADVSTSSFLQA